MRLQDYVSALLAVVLVCLRAFVISQTCQPFTDLKSDENDPVFIPIELNMSGACSVYRLYLAT